MAGVDGQWCQHREDRFAEVQACGFAEGIVQRVPAPDVNAMGGQRRQKVVHQQVGRGAHLGAHLLTNHRELIAGAQPIDAAFGDGRFQLLVQARDPDHEKLVEVGRVDREELQALQHGHVGRHRLVQDARVERQPGALAVYIKGGIIERGGHGCGPDTHALDVTNRRRLRHNCRRSSEGRSLFP